ncbi:MULTISPECIES: PAS domain-containing methyl-accepting chemotaxis protein [Pseudomonas]|uniref:Methyl-accepting chemotaxis sensory transducer with Pas/Pac sensor n=2 Tax=Pseudomonas flexibilis TaxID=706570 RepID=A0A0B3BM47_9PSED|nr:MULTISPECIES: PAS domain-containing methyl-accepting chemotaxis protein [Pseudomonas]KHO63690.1 hypothetical protein PT85_14330 [Pseudomonas flexibilis]SCY28599.1 methyl-accepting chemotaxis sensory transducer with Pas/Pac sensor [Pseudomonas flexibilis]
MKLNLPVTGRRTELAADSNILSTTTPKGVITSVNPEFVKVSGFSEAELLGQSHNIVRHPDMPQAAFADLWQSLKAGRSWMGLVKNRCKNGDHYWVSAYVTPIVENGQVVECQSVRTRPAPEWEAAAQTLYADLAAGRRPAALRRPVLGLFGHLLGQSGLIAALVLLVGWLGLGIDPLAGLACAGLALLLRGASLWLSLAPWRALLGQARRIASNPLSQWIYTGRRDEFGEVAFALRMQAMESGAIIGRLGDASRQLAEQAERLQETVGRSDSGARRQQAEAEHIASAIEQLNGSVQAVAENAQHSAESATLGDHAAQVGKEQVGATAQAIAALAGQIEQTAERVLGLQAHSSRITSVIEVIATIAEQTNLLALNAAIEAARAGEAGRGFAVVADEVRNLAIRTQDSTRQIRDILGALQEQIETAATAMHDSQAQAERSETQAALASQALLDVHERVTAITEMSAQIARAVEEQSAACGVIFQSMEAIRDGHIDNVGHSQASREAALEVGGQADRLRLLARQFWDRRLPQAKNQ